LHDRHCGMSQADQLEKVERLQRHGGVLAWTWLTSYQPKNGGTRSIVNSLPQRQQWVAARCICAREAMQPLSCNAASLQASNGECLNAFPKSQNVNRSQTGTHNRFCFAAQVRELGQVYNLRAQGKQQYFCTSMLRGCMSLRVVSCYACRRPWCISVSFRHPVQLMLA
jgi:hypothetical protein